MLGFVIVLCIAASSVNSSPFNSGGALILANAEEHQGEKTFRGLLAWSMAMVLAAPLLVRLA